ncbi:MAG: hypothetical protein CR982_05190, partial [Candidatus Cloacimonadota bacterium]
MYSNRVRKIKLSVLLIFILTGLYILFTLENGLYSEEINSSQFNYQRFSSYISDINFIKSKTDSTIFALSDPRDKKRESSILQFLTGNELKYRSFLSYSCFKNYSYIDEENNNLYNIFSKNNTDYYLCETEFEKDSSFISNMNFIYTHPYLSLVNDSLRIIKNIKFYDLELFKANDDSSFISKYRDGYKLNISKKLFKEIKNLYPLSGEIFDKRYSELAKKVRAITGNNKIDESDIQKLIILHDMRSYYRYLFATRSNEIFKEAMFLGKIDGNNDSHKDLLILLNGWRFIPQILICYDKFNKKLLWEREFSGRHRYLQIGDVDNDGKEEILFGTYAPCHQPIFDYYQKQDIRGVPVFSYFRILTNDGKDKIIDGKIATYKLSNNKRFAGVDFTYNPDLNKLLFGLYTPGDYSEKSLLTLDLKGNRIDTLDIKYNQAILVSKNKKPFIINHTPKKETELIILSEDYKLIERKIISKKPVSFNVSDKRFDYKTKLFGKNYYIGSSGNFMLFNDDFELVYEKDINLNDFVTLDDNKFLVLSNNHNDDNGYTQKLHLLEFHKTRKLKKGGLIALGIEILLLLIYYFIKNTLFIPSYNSNKNYLILHTFFGGIYYYSLYGSIKKVYKTPRKISKDRTQLYTLLDQFDRSSIKITEKSFLLYKFEVFEVKTHEDMIIVQRISHDMKNDLMNIRMQLNSFQKEINKSEDRFKYKPIISSLSESLDAVSKKSITLSNFSNLESLNRDKIELVSVIEKILRSYLFKDMETIIEPNFMVSEANIIGVENKFSMAFKNLLNNAIDESEKLSNGKKVVEIKVYEERGFFIILIMNRFRKKIDIDKFFEIGFTTKESGSGAGVSISKQI